MPQTTTIIIGAGAAGLATSRSLADRGIDHVVLERGRIANSWKTERCWRRQLSGHVRSANISIENSSKNASLSMSYRKQQRLSFISSYT